MKNLEIFSNRFRETISNFNSKKYSTRILLPVDERVNLKEKLLLLSEIIALIILVLLGMFLDWVGILLLAVPIFAPIMLSLSWDGLFGFPGGRSKGSFRCGSELSIWSICRCRF